MKIGKPKSKRTPVRLRHKIAKASAEKQRKSRKEAKKNPQWRSRLKKDPGIPNLFPYKAKVLAEIEESRRKKDEEIQRRKEIAKAQRQGTVLAAAVGTAEAGEGEAEDEDEELLDEVDDDDEEDEMELQDESNPMAALLASAQARAQAYRKGDDVDVEDDDDDNDEDEKDEEWDGIDESGPAATGQPTRKALPKQALADPIKTVSTLLDRMQKTQDGIQRMIEHYQIPPLATAGSDETSRFLVEVARKRGRLGRGGIPNMHAAALIVLADLNEERLTLPTVPSGKSVAPAAVGREVQIVKQMAEPFRIEGLFGDDTAVKRVVAVTEMELEA